MPTNIIQTVEVISDFRDSDSHDCLVESNKKDSKTQRSDDDK
jgi:hypothetical protein